MGGETSFLCCLTGDRDFDDLGVPSRIGAL